MEAGRYFLAAFFSAAATLAAAAASAARTSRLIIGLKRRTLAAIVCLSPWLVDFRYLASSFFSLTRCLRRRSFSRSRSVRGIVSSFLRINSNWLSANDLGDYRSFLWQVLQRTRMRTILLHFGQRFVLRSIFSLVRGRIGIIQSLVRARHRRVTILKSTFGAASLAGPTATRKPTATSSSFPRR